MNRTVTLVVLGIGIVGALAMLAVKHRVFSRFGAPDVPPRQLTVDEQREIVTGIDSICDRPPVPKDNGDGNFFKSENTHGRLRMSYPGRGIGGKPCPNFSRLEALDYARECYLYRRQAFRDLLPLVFAAKTGGTLKNVDVEPKLHAVIDRKAVTLKPPNEVGDTYGYPNPSRSDLPAPETLGNVQYFLEALKERVIAGKADSGDLDKFHLVKAWVDSAFASYAAEHREMDALVLTIRQSGDSRLANAVAARRMKALFIGNDDWNIVTDQAQFSEEPFRLYDPGESKYPIRKIEDRDDYPDFGADWRQHPEDP